MVTALAMVQLTGMAQGLVLAMVPRQDCASRLPNTQQLQPLPDVVPPVRRPKVWEIPAAR